MVSSEDQNNVKSEANVLNKKLKNVKEQYSNRNRSADCCQSVLKNVESFPFCAKSVQRLLRTLSQSHRVFNSLCIDMKTKSVDHLVLQKRKKNRVVYKSLLQKSFT